MSEYVAPKLYTIHDIIETPSLLRATGQPIIGNKGSQPQVHHPIICDHEHHPQGSFEIELPMCQTSPLQIIETEGHISYGLRVVIYGKYDEVYVPLSAEIDAWLRQVPRHADSQKLKEVFIDIMNKQKGLARTAIEAAIAADPQAHVRMTPDRFKDLALKMLLPDLLERADPRGALLMDFCKAMTKGYSESLDADAELKLSILSGVKKEKEVNTPTAELLEMPFSHSTFGETHRRNGQTDYSKSPTIPIKFWESTPTLDKRRNDHVKLPDGDGERVLWSKIYLVCAGKTEPIKSFNELFDYLYVKGDSKKGKALFELLMKITVRAPTIYWNKGWWQLKAAKIEIMQKIVRNYGAQPLTTDRQAALLAEAREMAGLYGYIDPNEAVVEQPQVQEWHGGEDEIEEQNDELSAEEQQQKLARPADVPLEETRDQKKLRRR